MWKLGKVLAPVFKTIQERRKAANTPIRIGSGRYAYLEVRSSGGFITGTKGKAAFIWDKAKWLPLGNVAA